MMRLPGSPLIRMVAWAAGGEIKVAATAATNKVVSRITNNSSPPPSPASQATSVAETVELRQNIADFRAFASTRSNLLTSVSGNTFSIVGLRLKSSRFFDTSGDAIVLSAPERPRRGMYDTAVVAQTIGPIPRQQQGTIKIDHAGMGRHQQCGCNRQRGSNHAANHKVESEHACLGCQCERLRESAGLVEL